MIVFFVVTVATPLPVNEVTAVPPLEELFEKVSVSKVRDTFDCPAALSIAPVPDPDAELPVMVQLITLMFAS